jgi:pSer/pThr/pTyr-binding forkhead associated (FHA) protein
MEERKELRLGRGHESDMRIADVSISRYHATIRFTEGNIVQILISFFLLYAKPRKNVICSLFDNAHTSI